MKTDLLEEIDRILSEKDQLKQMLVNLVETGKEMLNYLDSENRRIAFDCTLSDAEDLLDSIKHIDNEFN